MGRLQVADVRYQMPTLASTRIETIFLCFITLLGFGLRLILLNRYPLREDEALYGFWALHFLHIDPWFLHVWPDKPPIFIWAVSAAFSLFGSSPAGGRFLNIVLSTLTIAIVAAISRRLWGSRSAIAAALAMALNPFAISFAPALFTDPLLILAGTISLYFALIHRPFWAGIWLAIAIMSKQQGVLYAPLIMTLLLVGIDWARGGKGEREKHSLSPCHPVTLSYFLLGLLFITVPILYWDSLRWSVAPSPWDWSVRNYAPLRFVPGAEWFSRAQQWGDLLWYLGSNWLVWGILLLGIVLYLVRRLVIWSSRDWEVGKHPISLSPCHLSSATLRTSVTLLPCHLIPLWSLAFIALHIITSVQIWDRYLLPLAPMMALAIGWLAKDWQLEGRPLQSFLSIFLVCVMFFPAWHAANGKLPIGGDHGDYSGLDEVLVVLKSERIPYILYHQALGSHYRFYLFDEGNRGAVDLRWYPNAVYLADNAFKASKQLKFLIQPDWSPTRDLEFYLHTRGLRLKRMQRAGKFVLYQITK